MTLGSSPVPLYLKRVEARPFLKWAGGKGQLLPELLARAPLAFGKYFEPFLGGGAGVLWYRLEQHGDFVECDQDECVIFENRYESKGTALAAHVLAGADYWVTPGIGITAEGRYTFASDVPGGDYDYSSIDLSGWHVTAGLSFRF